MKSRRMVPVMPYWEALGRTAIAKEDQRTSDQLTQYLNYSGIDAAMSYENDTSVFFISVPTEQADDARKLLDEYARRGTAGRQNMLSAPRVLHEPVFLREEDRFKDTTSAAAGFLAAGTLTFVAACANCLFVGVYHNNRLSASDITQIWVGLGFLSFGIYMMYRARGLKEQIIAEDNFITKVIEWFVSTYTADMLDESIRAAGGSPCSTLEERRRRRLCLIEDYLDREISIKSPEWYEYLTKEIYVSIFEKPKIRKR
jgi:hypothetical protein